MRGLLWLLGFAGIAPFACIMPAPGPEAPVQNRPRVASEADVKSLLDQAQRAGDAERYAESRDLARRALELTKTVRVAPRMLATQRAPARIFSRSRRLALRGQGEV